MNLRESVGMYLSDIGQEQAPKLGSKRSKETGRDVFRERLLEEQRFNRAVFVLIVALLLILFAVGIYFVLRNREQPLAAGAFLGGELVSFLLIIRWLRQMLLDKVYTDLLVRASDELDPEHLAKFVATWYELTTKAHPQADKETKRKKSEEHLLGSQRATTKNEAP